MNRISKSPSEKFPVYFNFSPELITGESIVSKVLTCVNAATGVSSKTAIVASESIVSPDVKAVIQAGTVDDEHKIQCEATTTFGNIYQRDLILFIQKEVTDYFTKQPGDAFLVDVDYTRRLEPGDALASATVTAIRESDGVNVGIGITPPPSAVVSTPQVIPPKAAIPVLGGDEGITYLIGVLGTSNDGYKYEKFIRMNVREY